MQLAQAVADAHEGQWRAFMRKGARGDKVRAALMETLDLGKPLPRDMLKSLNAHLRSLDSKLDLATRPLSEWLKTICRYPQLAIAIYASYGVAGLTEWASRRQIAQAAQSPWTSEREVQAARRCVELFGGVPSTSVLAKHDDPVLRGLQQHLAKPGDLKRFCADHGIKRVLTNVPAGSWATPEGFARIRKAYRSLCSARGRFVNDFELSNNDIHLDANGEVYRLELPGNTLRHYIKAHLSMSVKKLFEDLCDKGELPQSWKIQSHTPTTADGIKLDSWSEVRWYEACRVAMHQLSLRQDLGNLNIVPHPLIGGSTYKGDFALNGIYVEVLRHPLSQIENPTSKDAINYAKKVNARQKAYDQYQLKVLWVEPSMLADSGQLSRHFNELFSKATSEMVVGVSVQPASTNAPGHWFLKENRDQAIRAILSSGEVPPGRYPAYRQMNKHGFGGLTAFLNRQNKEIDKQDEAFRVQAICIGTGNNKPRTPTRAHVLEACRKHSDQLLKDQGRVTKASLASVFGFGASNFLLRVEPNLLMLLDHYITEGNTL
ncbi:MULTISPECIES: hypothetical protein [unclassified Pseudomonas]|uniref:hypothetical protein n=1 Tax=unclassified Pseudomonas TaxID=196821 RepID=UPI000A1F114B|nr:MULTISPECIES: hypothetical protein [unclassified Pseudomonas]